MNSLLGLNEDIASKISPEEISAYKRVTRLFLAVVILSLISCGYFGFLLTGKIFSGFIFAILMGFIHFCVIRISLITLMTTPLCLFPDPSTEEVNGVKDRARFNSADVTRLIFVGLISITIAVPLSAIFYHETGRSIEENHRREMSEQITFSGISGNSYQQTQLQKAHFPFIIFTELSHFPGYNILCIIFAVFVFSPLLLLRRLRKNVKFSYMELCRDDMRKIVVIDFEETLEQSQYYISKNYPSFKKRLSELSVYEDRPFNTIFKNGCRRDYSSKDEFLKSLLGK